MAEEVPIVLYVEDEESDRLLVGMAFAKEGLKGVLRTVNHGGAAIDYLSGCGEFTDRGEYPLPGVVLLDLNLPEVHGFDVLKWIRMHPAHSGLPVVIFSSSVRDEDRARARVLGANEFVSKPSLQSALRGVARRLYEQWCAGRVAGGEGAGAASARAGVAGEVGVRPV